MECRRSGWRSESVAPWRESYKAEVGDPRETPAEPLAATLISKNITVGAWDPHIDSILYPEGVVPVDQISDAEGYDMVIRNCPQGLSEY